MFIVETERLGLREFTEEDIETFFLLGSDSAVIRYTCDPGGGFRSREHALEILHSHPLADYREHGYGRWACVEKATHAVIGFAGLKFLSDLQEVDLGYRFLSSHWGFGYATESGKALVVYGFAQLKLPSITALVMNENTASIRVLDKLGFTYAKPYTEDGIVGSKYVLVNPVTLE